jgi:protease-4
MDRAPDTTPPSGPPAPAIQTPAPAPAHLAPRRSRFVAFFTGLGRVVAALATLLNLVVLLFVLALLVFLFTNFGKTEGGLREHFYAGNARSPNKIAVIRIEGVLFEGLTGYAMNQIDAAAKDDEVKAIVLRINSPGGTVTASDDLHKRLNDLRNGTHPRYPGPAKPIVVSMGTLAASGGYYIAMIKSQTKGDKRTVVLAEPTSITGSIGVYASFPNVKEWADENGVQMNVIKAGDIKNSGSPFKEMTKEEKEVWQHYVDHSYLGFLNVIHQARGLSPTQMQEDIAIKETLPIRHGRLSQRQLNYKRYRADGGIFTADQALHFQLIDRIGYLSDAIDEAAGEAGINENYRGITYDRPRTFLGSLLGIEASKPSWQFDAESFSAAAAPRLWYLAPRHELSGMLTALGH